MKQFNRKDAEVLCKKRKGAQLLLMMRSFA
jgi:hypothetical protein